MEKLDMKKLFKEQYSCKKDIKIIEVPPLNYITYQGKGNPGTSEEFQSSMKVLYGMAYTLKFKFKSAGKDFVVMPLEGQWWTDIPEDFSMDNKDDWNWKVMLALPDYISNDDFENARKTVKEKSNPVGLEKAKYESLEDGLAAQFLYIGPYRDEEPHIAIMHNYIKESGYQLTGRHREIYLNSPLRVSEEKLKTIIRQPIKKM